MRLLFLIISIFFLSSCAGKRKLDLIVHNALVYTVDEKFSTAQAIAVKDGKIVAVGTNKEILEKYSATTVVDANGKPVYPGLIDAHAHFMSFGRSLYQVDLFGATSMDEVIKRVQQFVTDHPNEKWIGGRGWDQNKFPGKNFPDNEKLSELFPNTPIVLRRVDGHAVLINKKAIELSAIKPDQTIAGGEIQLKNGALTGVLVDNATALVNIQAMAPTINDYTKWLQAGQQRCFQTGLTTISDCGLMYSDVEIIDRLQKEGKLDLRLYVMLTDDPANYSRYLNKKPYKTDRLYVKGIKLYADGALGSRGACLLQPYTDRSGWSGFLLSGISHFDSIARLVANTDYQLCTHAIGDSGNRMILKVYNEVLKGKNDKRWRIEHAQVVNPEDFQLFGAASIIPSVQPTHATSDMYWAGDRLGPERVKGAYAYKQLLAQNGWMPLGTDCPVEDISTLKTFLAAVTRKDAKGFPDGGFQMENTLSREEAIRGMTIWAAKGCFLENEVGSIEVGKKADFIILDKDLMKVGEKEILNTKVTSTYLGGKQVFGMK